MLMKTKSDGYIDFLGHMGKKGGLKVFSFALNIFCIENSLVGIMCCFFYYYLFYD